jgi:glycosyltransferase involved in cell wall biosynthesis
MRIAQLAPPFETVPPTCYGGTERVVSLLTEELVRRGHEVTLFASGDSQTSAQLVPIVDQALWHHPEHRNFAPFWTIALGKLAAQADEFDVMHNHLDLVAYPLARATRSPMVSTLHGRIDLPELVPIYEEFRDVALVSISDAQRQPAPQANWVQTIYHGIDLEEFTFVPQTGEYLAFLGRICPDKGLDTAIRVACEVGMPLKIAAREPLAIEGDRNTDEDRVYYDEVIKPLLCEPGVEFIGEVGGRDKDQFLGGAAALLFPIRWPEPFGLVMIEALACGTPVVALRAGSVSEVIRPGVTGVVCESDDGLVAAVAELGKIDRAACRAEAERRFSVAAMADGYEEVYERLVGERAGSKVIS